jgi:ABC-type cobalamin/Fe3+-siderophores transport system ATPase subunit
MIRLIRLEVEGGFLDGLHLSFTDGLNVLIGARGSGKTSVIEVLRYCLGVPAVTEAARKRATEQALWVLGEGCATLTIEMDGVERVIRRGFDQQPVASFPRAGVLFVSQKEIEAIGLDGASRRLILDGFTSSVDGDSGRSAPAAAVEAVARQLYHQRTELDDVIQQLGQLAQVPAELERAQAEQSATTSDGVELGQLQNEARRVSDVIGELVELSESYAVALSRVDDWRRSIEAARHAEPDLGRVPRDALGELRDRFASVRRAIDTSLAETAAIRESLDFRYRDADLLVGAKRRELADLNARIEALEEGAGRLSRTVSALREQEKRRQSLEARRVELGHRVAGLIDLRAQALSELAATTDRRYELRRSAAEDLNEQFEGEIKVDVVKAGEVGDYEAKLGRALQGSGLQWRDLARQLAARMSPRELVAAAEALDSLAIVDAAALSENRARRLVSHLAGEDLSEILLSDIDEAVEFSLLDGQEFKATSRLSLGQRCTVVLPLLLAQDPDIAVLDQPEDHLDNAFIVDTVVDVLRSRRDSAQRVIATHNANIPVLGEADHLTVLASSGSRAFVAEEGRLDDSHVVGAITRLMEGGAEAFRKRADFYSREV